MLAAPYAPFRRLALSLILLAALAGENTPAAAHEILRPRVENEKTFSESYTLIADLDGDVYVQLQVAVTNVGVSSRRGGCRLLWIEGGEPTWTESAQVSSQEWSHRGGDEPTLTVGRCSLRGGAETVLKVAFDSGEVTLKLNEPIEPVRPLDRRMQFGTSFYESDILVPWASAEVTVIKDGLPARTLRGHGYGDHSRSTTMPADLAKRWVRFRGLNGGSSVLLLARFPSDGGAVDGWMWREGQASPEALREVRLERRTGSDEQWDVHAESVSGSVIEIATRRQIHRYAPMEENGLMGRMLQGIVGNPVTRTYRAELREPGSEGAELGGIAEVTIIDE